jgi:hypothetical protein
MPNVCACQLVQYRRTEAVGSQRDQNHRPVRRHIDIDQQEIIQQQDQATDHDDQRPEPGARLG